MLEIPNFLKLGWAENIERTTNYLDPRNSLAKRMIERRDEYYFCVLTTFALSILSISNAVESKYCLTAGICSFFVFSYKTFNELKSLYHLFEKLNPRSA